MNKDPYSPVQPALHPTPAMPQALAPPSEPSPLQAVRPSVPMPQPVVSPSPAMLQPVAPTLPPIITQPATGNLSGDAPALYTPDHIKGVSQSHAPPPCLPVCQSSQSQLPSVGMPETSAYLPAKATQAFVITEEPDFSLQVGPAGITYRYGTWQYYHCYMQVCSALRITPSQSAIVVVHRGCVDIGDSCWNSNVVMQAL